MNPEAWKGNDRRLFLIIGGGGLLLVLCYLIYVLPRAASYRHTLRSLRLEQVQSVRLHTEDLKNGEVVRRERLLKADDIETFLDLISKASSYSPNHPRGGWTCFVDIDTDTDVRHFSFLIHSTSNNGVHFTLWSNGKRGDGWCYGTLRNDDLGPFIESLFRQAK